MRFIKQNSEFVLYASGEHRLIESQMRFDLYFFNVSEFVWARAYFEHNRFIVKPRINQIYKLVIGADITIRTRKVI